MPAPSMLRDLGTKQVTIVHLEGSEDEVRIEAEALIQAKSGFFDIATPIYEGDIVEFSDPRGGTDRKQASEVHVNDFGPEDMRHTKVVWGAAPAVRVAPVRRLSIEHLHSEVAQVASDLFADGHHSQAVAEAFKSLEVRLRRMTGADKSGVALVGEALGGPVPKINLATSSGRSGVDEREGYLAIFRGVVQAVRNPKAHELATDEDPWVALEYLGMASLLHRRLDGGQRNDCSGTE